MAEQRENYLDTIGTWREQRTLGFTAPLEALGDHELRTVIEKEIDELTVSEPSLEGYEKLEELENIEVDYFTFSIHKVTGGLSRLYNKKTEREWCDEDHQIGLFQYDVYNSEDYDRYGSFINDK